MASLLPNGRQQYFGNDGFPLVGGQLFTYDVGTANPRLTWADENQVNPNTNPVILDARGEAVVFWSGDYTVVLLDALGNQIWTEDGVNTSAAALSDNYAVDVGSANAYIANGISTASLVAGMKIAIKIANTNTGASTLNYDGLGPIQITWFGSQLAPGNLVAGQIHLFEYDGTSWQLLNGAIYGRTTAETSVGVLPQNYTYREGNVLRYGAGPMLTGATNVIAFQAALNVSNAGGAPAYAPAGTYTLNASLTPSGISSFYGDGMATVLNFAGTDNTGITGFTFGIGAFYGAGGQGLGRFFRDFQITTPNAATNSNSGTNVNNAFIGDFTATSGSRVAGIAFSNIFVSNFGRMFYLHGFWDCSFKDVSGYNNFTGYSFVGLNVRNTFFGGNVVRGPMTGTGVTRGVQFQSILGESTQSTQFFGAYFYGFDIGVDVNLALETQFIGCDISSCQQIGLNIVTINGGFWIRDSWIETQNSILTYGVLINALGSFNYQDIHISSNHIICDNPVVGSIGVSVGSAQYGVNVSDNHISFFDIGVYGTNAQALVCKHNRIDILTSVYSSNSVAVSIDANCMDADIGPNFIINGNGFTHPTLIQACSMTNGSANIGVTSGTLFPVGTPVEFDANLNGFQIGVTYYVISNSGSVISVSNTPAGSGIVATGASTPIDVFAAPVSLTLASTVPLGFQFNDRGAYLANMGGYTATVYGRVDWSAGGRQVTQSVNTTITGTSNLATFFWLGAPSFLGPRSVKNLVAIVTDSGVITVGNAQVAGTGNLTFGKLPGANAGFTASGVKAVVGELTYTYS